MSESYWMDMPGGHWLHKCPTAKFEVTLGPKRLYCVFEGCIAEIPTERSAKKKDDPIPNSSWGLKKTPEDQSLDSFK